MPNPCSGDFNHPVNQSINQSILRLSRYVPGYLLILPSVQVCSGVPLFLRLSRYVPGYLYFSVCPGMFHGTFISPSVQVCSGVPLFLCLSKYVPGYLFISQSVKVCSGVPLFLCLSRYVPGYLLECFIPQWFHGRINRDEAKCLLNKCSRDGTFLVKERSTEPGTYALSVWTPDSKIIHVPLGLYKLELF